MNNENEIVKQIIGKYNLDLGDDYFFVGATIIKKSDFPNSTEILYCEDGFNDDQLDFGGGSALAMLEAAVSRVEGINEICVWKMFKNFK